MMVAGIELIDEAYNANPASMAAALGLLASAKGRRVAVLGDMLELGADAGTHHRALAALLGAARADLVFAAGPQMAAMWDVLPSALRGGYAPDAATLAPLVISAIRPGDTVLVKGSNSSKMSVVVDAVKARGA